MPGLKYTMAEIPGGNTRRVYGTAFFDGVRWYAKVGDSLVDASWAGGIRPEQGLPIAIDLTNDGRGQSGAYVSDSYTNQPKPPTGAVMAVGVTTLLFAGDDGGTYTTDRFLGATTDYAINDSVYLSWDATKPTVMGVIADAAAPVVIPAPPPPPRATVGNGTTALLATASDTYGVGGWGRWATSQRGGEDVYTGTIAGYTVTGAWFYGAPRPELAGKKITRVLFNLPKRIAAAGSSGAVTVHFYAHTNQSRPSGEVNRTVGPHDVTIPAGFGGGTIELPTTFGPVLAAGGGISIAGDPYAGFISRLDNPEAGKVLVDWSA